MNFQVSIDGGPQTQFQFDGVCPGCVPTYNFTAYDIQSLHSANHTLVLALVNATGTNSVGLTPFYFDYAAVNETEAFPTQATSSTAPTGNPSTPIAHTGTPSVATRTSLPAAQ
jgi:hypothetical protein